MTARVPNFIGEGITVLQNRLGRFSVATCAALACLLPGWTGCGTEGEPDESAAFEPVFAARRKVIQPAEFPVGGPFSPGILAGDTLYLAGQVGRDPKTRETPEAIEDETRVAMENVGRILAAAELDFRHLVKCHVLLDDMDNYKPMNDTYAGFFPADYYPARTTVEIAGLAGGFRVEVSCIAFQDKSRIRVVRPPEGSIPGALGPYSPGVMAGDALYLSGQGGRDPAENQLSESVEAQAVQALENIGQVIAAAGLSGDDVVYANAYYSGCDSAPAVDRAFAAAFPKGVDYPRSRICLPRLPGGIATEITLFAESGDNAKTVYLETRSAAEAGGDIASQMSATLEKLGEDLRQAGIGFDHVVNANVYLRDVEDFQGMNGEFRKVFAESPPARTTVATLQPEQDRPVLVEVALIAVR